MCNVCTWKVYCGFSIQNSRLSDIFNQITTLADQFWPLLLIICTTNRQGRSQPFVDDGANAHLSYAPANRHLSYIFVDQEAILCVNTEISTSMYFYCIARSANMQLSYSKFQLVRYLYTYFCSLLNYLTTYAVNIIYSFIFALWKIPSGFWKTAPQTTYCGDSPLSLVTLSYVITTHYHHLLRPQHTSTCIFSYISHTVLHSAGSICALCALVSRIVLYSRIE